MTLHIAVRQDSAATREEISRRLLAVWPYENPPALRSIQDQITLGAADLTTAVRLVLWVAGFATLITGCGLYFFSAYTRVAEHQGCRHPDGAGGEPGQR